MSKRTYQAGPVPFLGFVADEWKRLLGLYGIIIVLHLIGWGLFFAYHNSFGAAYAGAGALAYGFGLRHAFDADHISAVDDTTRLFVQRGQRPLGVGFFFSLGHSTIVLLLSLGLAVSARAIQAHMASWNAVGTVVGATVSGSFLWMVGIINLIVFWGIWRVYRDMKAGRYQAQHVDELLGQRGFMNRLFGGRLRRFTSKSWQMYPVGVLFGLGFDTATEVGLLAVTAVIALNKAGGGEASLLGIIALPILFAAGMSLMDTTDGVFMAKAYHWAFTTPFRKIYYNLITTGLSVFVALAIGTIEYLQVLGTELHIDNTFFSRLDTLGFETLGIGIVGTFLLVWGGSLVYFKLTHAEQRAVVTDGDE